MERWLVHVSIVLIQSLLLVGAAWSWAACCAVLAARYGPAAGILTATRRSLWLAGLSSALFVAGATVDLYFVPSAELLGIRRLTVSPPYTWWVWSGLLVCELVVTFAKSHSQRHLLELSAARAGHPLEVKPKWVGLCEELLLETVNLNNYV